MGICGDRVGMAIDQGCEGHRVLMELLVALEGGNPQPILEICSSYKRNAVIYELRISQKSPHSHIPMHLFV
ncbi:hypothetical protein D3C75_1323640 [compost metagenome]